MNDKRRSFDDIGFGYRPRAVYACDPARSRGRLYNEAESPTRTAYQRDRDRIIHSTAFRRLKHKTQVFIAHEGDHYRTRLTHTIEVAQIARAIARALHLDEDLAEAVALVHDFGHPPFGHTGEEALDAKMAPWGGFDHNAQSLRVVTDLERRYAEFDGLNLSWETLEGLVKHNGPLTDAAGNALSGDLAEAIAAYCRNHDLEPANFASLEAQAAAIADDIAYDAHDIDDGLRSGLLTLEMLAQTPIAGKLLAEVRTRYPGLDATRIGHEVVRRQITMMVEDVISNSKRLITLLQPSSPDAVRAAGHACVAFSPGTKTSEASLKSYLYGHLYRHPKVMEIRVRAEIIVNDLFDCYMDDPASMPQDWRVGLEHCSRARRARVVADFLAGMTDTYAIKEHRRLFDRTPDLL